MCAPTGRAQGYAIEQPPASYPHMASPWLTIGPECIYWAVRNVCELWNPRGDLHHGERLLGRRRGDGGRAH